MGDNPELYASCKTDCGDGHWLIAIGYGKDNIYFEDRVLDKLGVFQDERP